MKLTLDFRASYRAITNDDILHDLQRNTFGFDGEGIPFGEVAIVGTDSTVILPASNLYSNLDPFLLNHSARADQFDLIGANALTPYLRFQIAVEGPPLWENYVQAIYSAADGYLKYSEDFSIFMAAEVLWEEYIRSHPFTASAATLSDSGGLLAEFSSGRATLVQNFGYAVFFPLTIHGSNFNDEFSAGLEACTLYGGNGDDTLRGLAGNDGVYGGNGADFLFGGAGVDVMFGGADNDTMQGGDGSDVVKGGDGLDSISGGLGNDSLLGNDGADLLYGDDGNDSLTGGLDNDTLNAGTGADTLDGQAGNDGLSGGEGNDVLYGDDGADFLRGGLGRDTLTGDAGRDVFDFNAVGAANADRIIDFVPGTDRIKLSPGAFAGVHAVLNPQEFRLGAVAVDGDDRILYDTTTGRLYYDADGTLNGALSAPAVLFAFVANHAALTYQDFYVL